ncbi:MAG TPA: 23S rRNA (guanosine(2251)-2'-O)-methyltransferase RlmB [Bacteroidales bacterium]|nr:23S rRNA (guanosine(2251)-2'-O)-methyltransferase RlmB [Bacteroidales bacterium]HSA44208.1 23S rRNA (guanosine(2251)-2'-O)-methyltransferase RlmB [Bacteroidales bacterium]
MTEAMVIYGIRPVQEALHAGKTIDKILIQKGLHGDQIQLLFHACRERDIPFQFVPVQKLNRISSKNHQGVIAFVSPVSYYQLEQWLPGLYESGKVPLILIADRITDVRNFGALCRTAEACAVDLVLFPSRGSAALNEDAVKTSAGAMMRVPLCREPNLKLSMQYLKDSGVRIIGVSEHAQQLFYQQDYTLPTALLLGSEEDGISPAYLPYCDALVKLPMLGEIASLNVSVAGGVVMYAAVVQRMQAGM